MGFSLLVLRGLLVRTLGFGLLLRLFFFGLALGLVFRARCRLSSEAVDDKGHNILLEFLLLLCLFLGNMERLVIRSIGGW